MNLTSPINVEVRGRMRFQPTTLLFSLYDSPAFFILPHFLSFERLYSLLTTAVTKNLEKICSFRRCFHVKHSDFC